MDGLIKFFTTEAGLFVRNLRFFSNIDNVHINQQIADLLREAVCNIQELFNKVEIVKTPEQSVVDLIFGFDERQYSLRRFLECNSCAELITLSTDDFEAHLQLKHQNATQNVSNSVFSSDALSDAESTVCQNKMATSNCRSIDHNHNYVHKQTTEIDEDSIYPKYSEVISNSIPSDGLERGTSSCSMHSSDDQSECQARDTSVDSGYGTTYLLKIRGLPWTTTKKDLRNFFGNVNILHDLDGIQFITDDENNFGVAYIQLPTRKDYELAQAYHRHKLDERYIEVLKATKQDFTALGNIQKSSTEDKVLRLEGLPWNSKENEIVKFFGGLKIDVIHLIVDKTTDYTLEVFVRFATSDDYDLALKRNWKIMGNRHVKIFRSSEKQMHLRISEQHGNVKAECKLAAAPSQPASVPLSVEKVPEEKVRKDEWQRVGSRRAKAEGKKTAVTGSLHVVLARGFPWKVTKSDVISFFKGVKILNNEKGVNIMKNVAMEAYVELVSKADAKKALAFNNKQVDSRTIRVSEVDAKEYSRVASCISEANDSKVVQIRGLPWSVNKNDIMELFPTIKLQKNQIKIEVEKNSRRRTGYAFVEFETVEDYDAAFKTDFSPVNQFIKLFKATKEQFTQAIATNK